MTMATSSSDYTRCPFSYGMFVGTATVVALLLKHQGQKVFTHQERQESLKTTMEEKEQILVQKEQEAHQQEPSSSVSLPPCEVVFVLGGPGAGKGTQCQLLQERLGGNNNITNNDITATNTNNNKYGTTWVHLSAGDLLRAERQAGGELSDMINAKISAGELVPSEITCRCLEKAMLTAWEERIQLGCCITKFLIDGFPRSHENMKAWEDTMSRHTIKFVLNFECPEEVLVGRLLERGKESGRSDDNIETIRKRFKTHQESAVPIIDYFQQQNIPVHTIDSAKSVVQVYATVLPLFK